MSREHSRRLSILNSKLGSRALLETLLIVAAGRIDKFLIARFMGP